MYISTKFPLCIYLTSPYIFGLEFKFRVWINEVLVLCANVSRAFLLMGLRQGAWVSAQRPVPARQLWPPRLLTLQPHLPQNTPGKFIICAALSWGLYHGRVRCMGTCDLWGCRLSLSHVSLAVHPRAGPVGPLVERICAPTAVVLLAGCLCGVGAGLQHSWSLNHVISRDWSSQTRHLLSMCCVHGSPLVTPRPWFPDTGASQSLRIFSRHRQVWKRGQHGQFHKSNVWVWRTIWPVYSEVISCPIYFKLWCLFSDEVVLIVVLFSTSHIRSWKP